MSKVNRRRVPTSSQWTWPVPLCIRRRQSDPASILCTLTPPQQALVISLHHWRRLTAADANRTPSTLAQPLWARIYFLPTLTSARRRQYHSYIFYAFVGRNCKLPSNWIRRSAADATRTTLTVVPLLQISLSFLFPACRRRRLQSATPRAAPTSRAFS